MGKSSKPTIGFWYHVAYHHGLTTGPIDAFLEFRGGDKTAWAGEITASGTISVNAPYLWGGEKDQGGIVGDIDLLFGEAAQVPNEYLKSVFGDQVPAWRGFTTLVFKGGRYGAMNPYPQKPSYKFRRIKKGWDNDTCWYPETAQVVLGADGKPAGMIERFSSGNLSAYSAMVGVNAGFSIVIEDGSNAILTGSANNQHNVIGRSLAAPAPLYRVRVRFKVKTLNLDDVGGMELRDSSGQIIFGFNAARDPQVDSQRRPNVTFIDQSGNPGNPIGSGHVTLGNWYVFEAIYDSANLRFKCSVTEEASGTLFGAINIPVSTRSDISYLAWVVDDFNVAGSTVWDDAQIISGGTVGYINPAHVLYESRTCSDMGREPSASINDSSLRAAADQLFAEGFGICPKYDPAGESIEDFEKRICKLIGGSFSRSLVDGQWYLDLARGDYDLASLPILTDDDILEFKEQPTVLDNAINSVSVKYFDPELKQTIVTPPVRAMALVASFGTIHQTNEYPEIPSGDLATRIALRDLLTTATPTRGFDLTTTRRPYSWRPGQYFRLQSPKRGITDMVCIVGDIQSGQLKSGAIKLKATQDIYSLPATSFVQVEPGVDTRPSQTPTEITLSKVVEAPYVEVVGAMSRADLAVLPPATGYAIAVAAQPASELDFAMMVDPGTGTYDAAGRGDWAATAEVVAGAGPLDTAFTLSSAVHLEQVAVGMGALWDGEIVRVDEVDAGLGTITLGRGCADTTPALGHAASSRLWFYEVGLAFDSTEFTDGETINVKVLSNTGSQQFALGSAAAAALTFNQRQFRPYAPGLLQISDLTTSNVSYPSSCVGALTATWAHRDRVSQADQLVDASMASIGPEAGTTYTVRYYINNVLDHTESGVTGTAATPYTLTGDGTARIEVWAVRDSVKSWQAATAEFNYLRSPYQPYVDESGNHYVDENGDRYVG
ncbi:MAG: hypothetical protein JSR63_07780 [Proteobacteria bacterium]|nr:hypothetical protein [Pseudomonadota bacterium]